MIRKLFTASVFLITAGLAQAQFTPANSPVKITEVKATLEKSPEFNIPIGPQRKSTSQDWLWIEVAFTYKGLGRPLAVGQADEIAFNYYVLLKNPSPENRTGTLLTGTVTHTGVTPGKEEHHSLALISPQTLRSYFGGAEPSSISAAIQAIGVTATIQGQLAGEVSIGLGKGKPQWWQSLQPGPTGLVLSKDQSPFAPLFYDYFEAVKAKGAGY